MTKSQIQAGGRITAQIRFQQQDCHGTGPGTRAPPRDGDGGAAAPDVSPPGSKRAQYPKQVGDLAERGIQVGPVIGEKAVQVAVQYQPWVGLLNPVQLV